MEHKEKKAHTLEVWAFFFSYQEHALEQGEDTNTFQQAVFKNLREEWFLRHTLIVESRFRIALEGTCIVKIPRLV